MSVRRIYEALKTENLLENTLFIFASDNGGVPANTQNYPLREGKGTFMRGHTHPVFHVLERCN